MKKFALLILFSTLHCFGYDVILKNDTSYIMKFNLPVKLWGCDDIDWELKPGETKKTHLGGWCAGACFGYPSFAVKNPDPGYTSITKMEQEANAVASRIGCGDWVATLQNLQKTTIDDYSCINCKGGLVRGSPTHGWQDSMNGKLGYQGVVAGAGYIAWTPQFFFGE